MDIDKGLGCFADLKLDIRLNPDTPDERIYRILCVYICNRENP
jgi:hypothetical protein